MAKTKTIELAHVRSILSAYEAELARALEDEKGFLKDLVLASDRVRAAELRVQVLKGQVASMHETLLLAGASR